MFHQLGRVWRSTIGLLTVQNVPDADMDDEDIIQTSDVEEQGEIELFRLSKRTYSTTLHLPNKRVKVRSPLVLIISVQTFFIKLFQQVNDSASEYASRSSTPAIPPLSDSASSVSSLSRLSTPYDDEQDMYAESMPLEQLEDSNLSLPASQDSSSRATELVKLEPRVPFDLFAPSPSPARSPNRTAATRFRSNSVDPLNLFSDLIKVATPPHVAGDHSSTSANRSPDDSQSEDTVHAMDVSTFVSDYDSPDIPPETQNLVARTSSVDFLDRVHDPLAVAMLSHGLDHSSTAVSLSLDDSDSEPTTHPSVHTSTFVPEDYASPTIPPEGRNLRTKTYAQLHPYEVDNRRYKHITAVCPEARVTNKELRADIRQARQDAYEDEESQNPADTRYEYNRTTVKDKGKHKKVRVDDDASTSTMQKRPFDDLSSDDEATKKDKRRISREVKKYKQEQKKDGKVKGKGRAASSSPDPFPRVFPELKKREKGKSRATSPETPLRVFSEPGPSRGVRDTFPNHSCLSHSGTAKIQGPLSFD